MAEEAWYVVDKTLDTNVLVVAQGAMHPALLSRGLECSGLHWVDAPPDDAPLSARIRYRQADQDCVLEEIGNGRGRVSFAEAQRAVTPGQYVVFYQGEHCLGGGVIEQRIP
jgi:tRNA-specific 2-thiouridylase